MCAADGCRAHTRSAPADSRHSVPAGELTALGVATAGARKTYPRTSGPPAEVAVPKCRSWIGSTAWVLRTGHDAESLTATVNLTR